MSDLDSFMNTSRIRQVREEAREALSVANEISDDMGHLQYRVKTLVTLARAQSQTIERLDLLVGALTGLLLERGVLDRAAIDSRIEQDLAIQKAEAEFARAEAKAKASKPAMVMCTKCKQRIPQTSALMTESGLICSDCFQAEGE